MDQLRFNYLAWVFEQHIDRWGRVKMEEILITELLPFIQIAFEGDKDLPTYHISDGDYANHTYNQIIKTAEILPLKCYKVGDYGFTVLGPQLLYSFGINVNHRDKKTLENWFISIKEILPTFEVVLHGKNSRAINHLIKQGMEIKEQLIVLSCQQVG